MKSRLVLLGVAALLALALTAPTVGGANAVSSGAASAKSTASQALNKANKALKKANQATAKANAAQTTADSALNAAANAQDAAEAAQASANSALTAANSKYDTVVYEDSTVTANDQTDKIIPLTCTAGRKAVGGGYTLGGNANAAYVNINIPYGPTAWITSALDNGAVNANWTLQVSVNCIGAN